MTDQIPAPAALHETDGPLHVRADRPIDVHFSFEQRRSGVGVGASVGAHVVAGLLAILIMRYQPERRPAEITPDVMPLDRIVWIAEPGPGGGGGGGGNKSPEPPRKAELPGKDKITIPVEKKPAPTPPKVEEPEPPPLEAMNIPAMNMAAGQQTLPRARSRAAMSRRSRRAAAVAEEPARAPAPAIGSGQGSGLGPGRGGGTGGGAYRPGAGITLPRVLREAKPQYTADAMRAKVQGSVWLECIVMPDGSVGDVRVTKSLDPIFGLDQEAIKAAKLWRFSPGMRQGEPVPVIITIELTFTLR